MRSGRLTTAFLCGCFLAAPVLAADPPKDVDGDNLPAGTFTGKLTIVPGTDGSFTMKVEFDHVQLKPGAANNQNRDVQRLVRDQERIEKTQVEIARARNMGEYNRLVQQLAGEVERLQAQTLRLQLQGNTDYTIKKEFKDIDFHTADDVKVRIMTPPVQFDDKGNVKEYTKDELKALKGKDSDLPGYESTLDYLKVGDTIKVTLATPKPPKKDADNAADPTKKDADTTTDPTDMKKGHAITLIVILSEDGGDNAKPKKGKN